MPIIKIVSSPFNPALEAAEGLIISLHVPYSNEAVTVKVNPNLTEYSDQPEAPEGVELRQVTVSQDTNETHTLSFDFKDNNEQEILVAGEKYRIKLLNIGKEEINNQSFPSFEFQVEKRG